jgi:type II secretory pathway pseudopilin PulG
MITAMQRGFTIIELMLFLAISGALFAALMIGVGDNIVQQQYRESVTSYSTLLQQQYSQAASIQHSVTSDWACSKTGAMTQSPTNDQARGISQCMILGRAIQIAPDGHGGTNITTSSVVGVEPSTNDFEDLGDIPALLSYTNLQIASFDVQPTSIDWGSSLVTATSSHLAASGLILILRSPSSGLLREFVTGSPSSDVRLDIDPSYPDTTQPNPNATTPLKMCVKGNNFLQPTESVSVDPRVSGPDSITLSGMDTSC